MFRIKLPTKGLWAHTSISLRSGTRGSKDLCFWNIIMHYNESITLEQNAAKITDYNKKMLQIKAVQNLIFYKKVSRCIWLSLPGVKLGGSKNCHVWNIIMYWYLANFFKTFQNNFRYCIKKQNKGIYSQP